MKETNLDEVKNMAINFLYLPIEQDETISPFLCVHHPFITSCIVCIDDKQMIDVLNNPDALKAYRDYMEKNINNSNLCRIYLLLRKPYRLAFIKYCEPYLSDKDLAELFADAWVSSENPNQDVNCPISYLIKIFKRCNKEFLMTPEDYDIYNSLPDTFVIYRGVGVSRNPKGLSWTRNLEKAKWFASRFDTDKKKGYVQTGIAKKEHVLAYFNTRGEDEIVYNVNKLDISILERT